ncbi:helix-turn-helix domain-containing protein [Actinoplanes sp. NPDC049802]|uniref:helix-turn-helix domain-containing protein n=1 Tax=Actinoplanes sp. NPDC049802 TaxID=3154742 RepID=UPI0033CE8D39
MARGVENPETIRLASPSPGAILKVIQDCGADLVSIRDRRVVLQGVVRRARLLLGSDMAYISLNDLARGETFIHTTDGVRTEAYRAIRMPLGTGVLGKIAAGKSAAHTIDYLTDSDLAHFPEIDGIVAGEGVRTVTGVPIQTRGRIVGALLVAHRARAVLPERGRFALEQLAVQAAIVIDQVARSNEVEQLRDEIGARDASTASRLRELERMLDLDDSLMGGLVSATDPGGVLEVLAGILDRPVSLYNPAGDLLMGEPVLPDRSTVEENQQVNGAVNASSTAAEPATLRLRDEQFTVMGIAAGNRHLGTLAMPGAGGAESGLLRRAASFVGAAMLVESTLADADQRADSRLIEDLLMSDPDRRPVGLMQRLAEHGIGQRTVVTSLCILTADGGVSWDPGLVRNALRDRRAIVSPHAGHVCALIASSDGWALGETVREVLVRSDVRAAIGIARSEGVVPGCLRPVHQESVDVARAALALGSAQVVQVHDVTSLGVAGLLLSGADPAVADHVIGRFVGPLLDYDQRRGTLLTETAWHYLEHQGRLASAAEALHVHPNTLKQRVARIDKLLGSGWRRTASMVDTQFALRLWRLRQRAHSTSG